MAATVLACVGFASAALAWDDTRARTYAFAFTGAAEAKQNCPGMEMNTPGLSALRDAAQLGSDRPDRDFLKGLFAELRPPMEREIAAKGRKTWCASAYGIFSPSGYDTARRE